MRATAREGGARSARLGGFALALALAFTLPGAPVSAEHCFKDFILFSGRLIIANPGFVGCEIGEEEANTDLIVPGSNTFVVRVFNPDWRATTEAPTGTLTFSGIQPVDRLGCSSGVCELQLTPFFPQPIVDDPFEDENGNGEQEPSGWDSQQIPISQVSSINGGDAVIEICWDEGDPGADPPVAPDCETRTYRTIIS